MLLTHRPFQEIVTKRYYVDFFFDKSFSIDNPHSKYSRSMIYFGGPLDGFDEIVRYSVTCMRVSSSACQSIVTLASTLSEEANNKQMKKLSKYLIKEFYNLLTKRTDPDYTSVENSYYLMPALIIKVILKVLTVALLDRRKLTRSGDV